MNDHGFRVFKAICFIEENILSDINLESIASAGAFSAFHFHRVFSSLMGVTLSDYIRRRRLSFAARRLLNSDQEILDIALECQYESQEAFTRAFKKVYEITPGQLRKLKKSIEVERSLTLEEINRLARGEIVNPEIVEVKEKRTLGVGRSYKDYDYQSAHQHWADFVARLPEIRAVNEDIVFGLGMESHPEISKAPADHYIYVASIEVDGTHPAPKGLVETTIPGGRYAKFVHKGPLASYGETFRKIWNVWLPESGLTPSRAMAFEAYGPKFIPDSPASEFEIYIPIKS